MSTKHREQAVTEHPPLKQSVVVELSFGRWTVPSIVKIVGARNSGTKFDAPSGLLIQEVSAENLSTLCDYFRADVFAMARKQDPRAEQTEPSPATTPKPCLDCDEDDESDL